VVEDESIFQYEVTLKRVWGPQGTRPRVKATGSKDKTCSYGALADDGTHLYWTYEKCNSAYFLQYAHELVRKYHRIILFIDKAPWHLKTKAIREFFHQHCCTIRVIEFPVGFPEANPVEETWREGKHDDRLGAHFHPTTADFKRAVSHYYRTRNFI
jgi:transposase